MLHTVNLRQELVDHCVVHARAAGTSASLLADGIQLIKDDDMQAAIGPQLEEFNTNQLTFYISSWIFAEKKSAFSMSHPLLLLLCLGEQFANVGLRLSYIFVKDLWAIHDFGFAGIKHFPNLPGHQGFTTAWRTKQQNALHVLAPWIKKESRIMEKRGGASSIKVLGY